MQIYLNDSPKYFHANLLVFGHIVHQTPYTMLFDLRHLIVFFPNYPFIRFKFTMYGVFWSTKYFHRFVNGRSQAHNNNINNWQKLKVKVLIHWLNGGLSLISSLDRYYYIFFSFCIKKISFHYSGYSIWAINAVERIREMSIISRCFAQINWMNFGIFSLWKF